MKINRKSTQDIIAELSEKNAQSKAEVNQAEASQENVVKQDTPQDTLQDKLEGTHKGKEIWVHFFKNWDRPFKSEHDKVVLIGNKTYGENDYEALPDNFKRVLENEEMAIHALRHAQTSVALVKAHIQKSQQKDQAQNEAPDNNTRDQIELNASAMREKFNNRLNNRLNNEPSDRDDKKQVSPSPNRSVNPNSLNHISGTDLLLGVPGAIVGGILNSTAAVASSLGKASHHLFSLSNEKIKEKTTQYREKKAVNEFKKVQEKADDVESVLSDLLGLNGTISPWLQAYMKAGSTSKKTSIIQGFEKMAGRNITEKESRLVEQFFKQIEQFKDVSLTAAKKISRAPDAVVQLESFLKEKEKNWKEPFDFLNQGMNLKQDSLQNMMKEVFDFIKNIIQKIMNKVESNLGQDTSAQAQPRM